MGKRIVLIYTFALLLYSCKDDKPHSPVIPDPEIPRVEFTPISTADATLQATYISTIAEVSQVGSITTFEGVAHAKFFDLSGSIAIPKSVVCEGYVLEEKAGSYKSHTESEQGIDFGSTTSWQITGRADIPSFNKEVASKVPEIGDINIRDSINSRDSVWIMINLKSAFTFLGSIDSVNYSLTGRLNELHYNVASANDSIGVSPEELKTLGTGKVYIRVEAYRIEVENQQGYNVAFINKGMFYKSLWLH